MTSILFGSIGTLADTSELQRESFNEAFRSHGLDWNWSQAEYQDLLQGSGGKQRIADYAHARGEDVDADAVHQTKSEIYQERLAKGATPRPGVAETIDEARRADVSLALVTTTSPANISALAKALAPDVDLADFQVIVDVTGVDRPKPEPDAYRFALERLGESTDRCVAIEDNVGGLKAAVAAGVRCVAFPGENNAGHDFSAADQELSALSFDELRGIADA